MDLIKTIEETQKRPGAQDFNVGDTVKVFFKIIDHLIRDVSGLYRPRVDLHLHRLEIGVYE